MKGIDQHIDRTIGIFTRLLWPTKTRDFYGRIFRNYRNQVLESGATIEQVIPEYFDKTTGQYRDVLLDDRKAAVCFFDVLPEQTSAGDGMLTATIHLCFAVNLKTVYPTLGRESTENAHDDVAKALESSPFNIVGLVRGFPAFDSYGFVKKTDDMNPFYLFRFNLNIIYTLNECYYE